MNILDDIYEVPDKFKMTSVMAYLDGKDFYNNNIRIPIDDMHLLVCGAPGMGKTYQIDKILSQTLNDTNSTHIIFDPKAEFCKKYYRKGIDSVISLFDFDGIISERWNIMLDIASDNHPETAIREIVESIFKEDVEKSPNPFFPEAAASLITAIWIMIYRRYKETGNFPNNEVLISKTKSLSRVELLNEASREVNGRKVNEDLYSTINKLTDPNARETTANIHQELQSILDKAFNHEGNFCSDGTFSLTDFIKNVKGRRLFFVYDFAYAESSCTLFGIMVNILMKQSLSNNMSRNINDRTYYYLDEFPVLPNNLTHMLPLCSFGRGYGNRVICGIQGISQLYDTYGEHAGDKLLSAFTNNIYMRVEDPTSLDKISKRSGKKDKVRTMMGPTRGSIVDHFDNDYNVSEHALSKLEKRQAIISMIGYKPFYIDFSI